MIEYMTINLPYACFYIEITDGLVTKAPPIGRWMLRKDIDTVKRWVIGKGGHCLT